MAQVDNGIYVGRQAPAPASELFWIWHDKTNKTEVWVYNIGTGGYTWPSATNTHATLDITYVVPAPPKPANQADFADWVKNRTGLTAAQILVQEMTYT